MSQIKPLVITLLLLMSSVAGSPAGASTGDLDFVDCFGSELDLSGANCVDTTADALRNVLGIVTTEDGEHLYAATGSRGNSIVHFARDSSNGELTFVGCISGLAANTSCTNVSTTSTALSSLSSLVLSPDEKFLYAIGRGDALVWLALDAAGTPSFVGCQASLNRPGYNCLDIGTETEILDSASRIAISPDGTSLYTTNNGGPGGVGHFQRASDGSVTFNECFSSGALFGCVDLSGTTNAVEQIWPITVSPGGGHVYIGSDRRDAIIHFTRNQSTGRLAFASCVSSDTPLTTGCSPVANDLLARVVDNAITIPPDGGHLYAAGFPTQALVTFGRNSNGSLTFLDCLAGGGSSLSTCRLNPNKSSVNNIRSLQSSGDGRSVYVGAHSNQTLAHFNRNQATGLLTFRECFSSATGANHGCVDLATDSIDDPEVTHLSADQTSLYLGGAKAITHFQRETPICVPNAVTMCLNNERFEVRVTWRDFDNGVGDGRVVDFAPDDSGIFYFFAADNFEMLIKVLDACPINNRFWVFLAATTTVEYTVSVRDTVTGETKEFFNSLANAAPAVADTDAFACDAPRPAHDILSANTLDSRSEARPKTQRVDISKLADASQLIVESWDQVELDALSTVRASSTGLACTTGDEVLCLNQSRFLIEVEWMDFSGNTGRGKVVPFGSADSGMFYFFDPDNVEILLKVLDACSFSRRFWFFAAATTTVEYTLTVTDTVTGQKKSYFNPLNNAAAAITDTDAFDTCDS